ncbi:MAG: methyltransferase domain-containing protein [Gemmatimonadaceae bacterium]|nr:methyltransferase domain-containing protein [Gemmatimonadaceae bacterium]
MFRRLIAAMPRTFRDRHRARLHAFVDRSASLAARLRGRAFGPRIRRASTGDVYLHLGCGAVDHPEFTNVDGRYAPHVHVVRALDDLSPFADGSIALLYACHCLEHFPHRRIPTVLAEWRRCLRVGGILRLSVPDFDLLLDIYLRTGRDVRKIQGTLMGGQDYAYNFHKTAFNRSSLTELLLEAGFGDVRPWTPGSASLTTFDDWSGRHRTIDGKIFPVSLNLECTRL